MCFDDSTINSINVLKTQMGNAEEISEAFFRLLSEASVHDQRETSETVY
jgi:hypothetical protein